MSSITCPGSRFVPIALLLVLSAPFLSADVLFLKNGQTVEGEVTEKADAYEVKTKYGALTVAKAEVKRRLKDAAALKAEVDVLHKSAKGMAEAGLADDADPAARGVKLEAAATLYERAIALCNDAKAVFTGSEADALAAAAATMTAELARVRAKLGPSTLEPPPAPPAAKPVNPPAGGAIPASIPPAAVPKPDPAVLDAAVLVRNPVPSSGKVRTSEKEIRTLFKDDYAVSTPDARQALARKLLKTALGTKDDPDAQYALLREAAAVGAKATDAATTVFALRLLSRRFAIDVQKEVSSTLSKLESSVRSPAIAQEVVRIYLRANLDAILHDEVEFAGAVVGRAERVARAARDADLLGRTKEQAKETKAFAKEFEAFRDAARKLGNDPDDPAANGAVGEFLCFVKDAWDQGLPYLARGDDKDLKALAADELAKPSTPAEQVALADRWTAWGDGQSPARRKGYGRERAMVWYDAALPGLRGAEKLQVERKMESFLKTLAARFGGMVQPGNVALASNGATAAGSSSAGQLIDGIKTGYTGSTGFASTSWPKGVWVVTLPKTYILRRIHFLLWDGGDRFYRYAVETSPDGERWVPLVDRSKGKWRSWQTIDFSPRRVKAIKVRCFYNSANSGFYIVELEAYCMPQMNPERPRYESEPEAGGPAPASRR